MEKELRILKAITVGIQGRVYDRVYYIVDGKQRSRAYTRPGDPKTGAQRACRGRMTALVKRWHALDVDQKEYWNAAAKQSGRKRTTGFNMFIRDGLLKAHFEAGREPAVESVREIRRFVRIVRPRGAKRVPVKSKVAMIMFTVLTLHQNSPPPRLNSAADQDDRMPKRDRTSRKASASPSLFKERGPGGEFFIYRSMKIIAPIPIIDQTAILPKYSYFVLK